MLEKVIKQCRKPKGMLGKLVAKGMNSGHAGVAAWGLTHIAVNTDDIILDIGCGGGRNVKNFANMALEGKVYGIDYSEVSVDVSKKYNKKLIDTGCVKIEHASVSSLSFSDNMFNLVSGFETYYFWPDLINDLREIYRVLKPGGTLILVNEGYQHDKFKKRNEKWTKYGNFECHTPEQFEEFLKNAGYSSIEISVKENKNWIAVKGKKADA